MGALSNYSSIAITRDTLASARRGFGKMLLLSSTPRIVTQFGSTRTREYSSYAEVIVDFPSTTGPEALFAAAAFAQEPHVASVVIGRAALQPTKVVTITPVVQNSHLYTLRLGGDGATTTTCTFTSDASATATEICDALRTLINAIVGKNFLATGTTTIIVTADAVGKWFWVEQTDLGADFTITETHADPGVATDLAAIALANPDWYALYTIYNSNAYALAAAAWVQSNERVYLLETNETTSASTAVGNSETLDDIHTLGYTRTHGVWHGYPGELALAAEGGLGLSYAPGSVTFALKRLTGVTPNQLTSTHRTNITARKANSYEPVGDTGIAVTFDGTVASGEYLDVIRDLDFVKDDISKAVFDVLVGNPKLPYTNAGIAVIQGVILARLNAHVGMGIFSNDPAPAVTVPLVADVSAADKAARRLTNVRFTATLAGAVHSVQVTGTVSL